MTLSVDIYFGERYYHTVRISVPSTPRFIHGHVTETFSFDDIYRLTANRCPSITRHRDLRLYPQQAASAPYFQ